MSKQPDALEFLEALQKRHNKYKKKKVLVEELPKKLHSMYTKETLQNALDDASSWIEEDGKMSQYEDESRYFTIRFPLKKLHEAIPDIFSFEGKTIRKRICPAVGSLNLLDFSAFILAPTGDPIIIIQNGLVYATNEISDIFTQVLFKFHESETAPSLDELKRHTMRNMDSIDVCIESILTYYLLGVFSHDYSKAFHFFGRRERKPSQEELDFSMDLKFGMDLFIIAHEYSHFLLGHFEKSGKPLSNEALQKQEYDADCLAAHLMCTYFPYIAQISLLSSLYLMNMIDIAFELSGSQHTTHPRAQDRLDQVINRVFKKFSYTNYANAQALYFFPVVFHEMAEFLQLLSEQGIKLEKDNFKIIMDKLYTEHKHSFYLYI